MSDTPGRRDQEPRGRWENRCDFSRELAQIATVVLTCDRPTGHRGMHSGRLWNGEHTVIGYGRLRT